MADKLLAGNFERADNNAPKLSDPVVPTPMVLTLNQLRNYEHNPRIRKNPVYDNLKISILNSGFNAVIPVTRRPGQEYYIVRNGFNTCLLILNELWKETKNEGFFRINCMFFPWEKESKVLTGHMKENKLRGDNTFIELALSVRKAKTLFEEETGIELTQRELARELTNDGYPIQQSQISRMFDAIDFLLPVIPQALYSGMSSTQVQKLITLRKQGKLIFSKYSDEPVENFTDKFMIILSMFDADSEKFDFVRLQDELIGQMGESLGVSYNLLALEFEDNSTEKLENKVIDPASINIDEVQLLSKNIGIANLTEEQIINIPMPVITRQHIAHTQTIDPNDQFEEEENSENDEQSIFASNGHHETFNFNDEPIANQISTIIEEPSINKVAPQYAESKEPSRIDAIKELIANIDEDDQCSIQQPVPATSGFYPVSDIWTIPPQLADEGRIKAHIGQLAFEIADELGAGDAIQLNEENLGFSCNAISTDATTNSLLNFLVELANNSTISALFIGNNSDSTNINPLSDDALIKLFRIIRLARKLRELEPF